MMRAIYQDREDCALYLQAAIDAAPRRSLVDSGRSRRTIAPARGMMQLARETGLSREGLYKLHQKVILVSRPSLRYVRHLGLRLHANNHPYRAQTNRYRSTPLKKLSVRVCGIEGC